MSKYSQTRESRNVRRTGRESARMMRRKHGFEKLVAYVAVTLLIVLLGTYFCSMTAKSLQAKRNAEVESSYVSLEQDMVRAVRGYLNRIGFKNSGVMLTRVVDEEGYRQYKLTVNHGKIDEMEDGERELLAESLSQFAFVDSMCDFRYEFLVLEQ
ncbi:MAG: hypothetical protein ACI4FY_02950 [Acetatifactor sp.]